MLLFGGIFYAIFAEGTVQPWADDVSDNDSDEGKSLKAWQKCMQKDMLFNDLLL